MLKKLLILLFLICNINLVKANNWHTSLKDAQKIALVTNKLLLVDFWATWCGPCKKMDLESWDKSEVQLLMRDFIPVKIDIDQDRVLAEEYGVRGIPYIFILDPNGKVLHKEMSYKTKGEVIKLLKSYRLSTEYVAPFLINYFKKQNFNSAFRLGWKYNEFALFQKDFLKKEILDLSKEYFRIAKQHIISKEPEFRKTFLQKIDLFEIRSKIILGNYNRAIRLLNKYSEEDIDLGNRKLFCRLKYIAATKSDDIQKSKLLYNDFDSVDRKKIEFFLKNL